MILPEELLQTVSASGINGDEDQKRKKSIDKLEGSEEIAKCVLLL